MYPMSSFGTYIKILLWAAFGLALLFGIVQSIANTALEERPEDQAGAVAASLANLPYATSTLYAVASVVDGDTINVRLGGETAAVRLIGINAPEIGYDSESEAECFAEEARTFIHNRVATSSVLLRPDPSQGVHDIYGRLLAYVLLPDGTNINRILIRNGFANEYTYRAQYALRDAFAAAENAARADKLGIWSDACRQATSTQAGI